MNSQPISWLSAFGAGGLEGEPPLLEGMLSRTCYGVKTAQDRITQLATSVCLFQSQASQYINQKGNLEYVAS